MNTVHKHINEIPLMTEERAKEIEDIRDEDIDYSDIPLLDESFFKKAKKVDRTKIYQKNKGSSISNVAS